MSVACSPYVYVFFSPLFPCCRAKCVIFSGVAESGEAEQALSPAFLGSIYDNIESRPIQMLLETEEGDVGHTGANSEEEADPSAFGEKEHGQEKEPFARGGGCICSSVVFRHVVWVRSGSFGRER